MRPYEVEYNIISEEFNNINVEISNYPKGSLRKRIISGKEYYYLQYRDGEHVKSRYVKGDEVEKLRVEIEARKAKEKKAHELQNRLEQYAELLGKHRTYRPVKNVDYEQYTLFMSTVIRDHKSMAPDDFLKKYRESKFRGLNKRYLGGFLDYISGIDRQKTRKTNDLVLDPYTYQMYFKYGKKEVLNERLEYAISAFLSRGLLITDVKAAIKGRR